jgi:hypothetical protein
MSLLFPKPAITNSDDRLISQVFFVLRFLLCLVLAGCSSKEDTVTSPGPQAPTIVAETSVSMSGPKSVILTATINANYRSTEYYFEYGPTTSYGMRKASHLIGSGGEAVVVRDTITGLPWDTTYHSHLVAENAAGRTSGSDRSFICASAGWTEFVYPLAAGTTWTYAYYYSFTRLGIGYQTRGTQIWQSTGTGTGDSIRILVHSIDTTRTFTAGPDTTIQTGEANASFLVVARPDSLNVLWYRLSRYFSGSPYIPGLFKIPRYVEPGKTTIMYDNTVGSTVFVSGSGLTSYFMRNNTMYQIEERLTLQSVSP